MSNLITLSVDETIASRPVGSNLDIVTKSDGTKVGVCNMVSFIPLSGGDNVTMFYMYAHTVAQYLAVKHLNTNDGSIVKELTGLNETCNIKFGLEFIDTENDPTVAGIRALQRLSLENDTTIQQESFDFGPCTFLESTEYNSVAEKTSYITALKGYTEVSGIVTQRSLDTQLSYPKFVRTMPTDGGTAAIAVDFMIDRLGTKYFVLLYVDTVDTRSYAAAIRDVVAHRKNITVEEVIINESWGNIQDVVSQLKELKFNTMYANLPDISGGTNTDSLMEEAYKESLAGDGKHTWIFSDYTVSHFFGRNYTKGSTLHSTYRGSGIIFIGDFLKLGKLGGKLVQLRDSPNDLDQIISMLPQTNTLNDTETSNVFRSDDFWSVYFSDMRLELQYEAVILSGLAACRAVDDALFLDGDNFYRQMLETKFSGLSGLVSLDKETGSRIPNSTAYSIFNFPDLNELDVSSSSSTLPSSENNNDYTRLLFMRNIDNAIAETTNNGEINGTVPEFPFQYRLVDLFSANKLNHYKDFVFNDGTTQPPKEIQQWDATTSRIIPRGGTVAVASILCAISILFALVCAVWTFKFRKTRIVRASQPFFLYFICLGTIFISLSIVPKTTTTGCMSYIFLLGLGASVILSSFFSKTHRINKIIKSSLQCKRIKITIWDAIKPMAVMITLNVVLLITWFVINPIEYVLTGYGALDRFGRELQVYGKCSSEGQLVYAILLGILNGGMLVLCAYQAWQARNLSTEFQETQHILHILLILGGVFCIGFPVLLLNKTSPDITLFISSVMVFASCISILFMMFVPKFRYKEKKEQSTWSGVTTAGAPTVAGTAALTGSAITSNSNNSEDATRSFNLGEKILTTKTNKELLTENDTLRRRLREHEAGVFLEEQQNGGTSDSNDNKSE